MAEILAKSIQSEKKPKEVEVDMENLPKQKETELLAKDLTIKEKKYPRGRAGHVQMAPNPYRKPKIIEDGRKIK